MGTEFQKRVNDIMHQAMAERDALNSAWRDANKLIARVLYDANNVLNGTSFKDSNGDSVSLVREKAKLEFRLDRDRRKVIRTSTHAIAERIYDFEEIDAAKIQTEVEDFVRVIYRS